MKQYSKQIESLFEEQNNLRRHIDNLKSFINELENNNMELVRLIENKTHKEADEHRSRLNGVLDAKKDEINHYTSSGTN